uniref:4Fe-4S ferredoxin n=1 Tax=candidate division WOR-3 bacterium TaxID=2052148 RepID=A0A7C4YH96_UNCW3
MECVGGKMKIIKKGDIIQSARYFVNGLFEKGFIDGLVGTVLYNNNSYITFFTDKKFVDTFNPFFPSFQVSTAQEIKRITKTKKSERKFGVILRPCELNAFVELVKFKQIEKENILVIGIDCFGAYDNKRLKDIKEPFSKFIEDIKNDNEEDLRRTCSTCLNPVPNINADIVLGYLGLDGDGVILIPQSEAGNEIIKSFEGEDGKEEKREEVIKKIIERRRKKWEEVKERTIKEVHGIDNLLNFFKDCITCHNCKDLCPICFCKECFWESPVFEYKPENFFLWGEKKGGTKMPLDTIFFHVGRLTHMSHSCVGCGLCEDACPRDIELQRLFYAVGEKTREIFSYQPGRDYNEPPPLTTFKEEELRELG